SPVATAEVHEALSPPPTPLSARARRTAASVAGMWAVRVEAGEILVGRHQLALVQRGRVPVLANLRHDHPEVLPKILDGDPPDVVVPVVDLVDGEVREEDEIAGEIRRPAGRHLQQAQLTLRDPLRVRKERER